jgi:hypothetical protein
MKLRRAAAERQRSKAIRRNILTPLAHAASRYASTLRKPAITDPRPHRLPHTLLATEKRFTRPPRCWPRTVKSPPSSATIGIEKQSYTKVVATQPKDNLLTVQKEDGATVTYNPARLYGVNVYRELEREFAVGDRLGFTAPSKELDVANRDLGTVQQIDKDGQLSVKMDNGKFVSFDANQMRHFDHGYAVTSHSSQGLTADRVLVNIDTKTHPELINPRFAYVSVSRAALDAQIFTDNASTLTNRLDHIVSKTSAVEMAEDGLVCLLDEPISTPRLSRI